MSTAVILAGGESRRMQKDKLSLRFGKQTLLESAVERYERFFDKVYISVADPEKYPEIKSPRIVDIKRGCGPMGGLHASLMTAAGDGVFLVAADMPFSDPAAARRIMELTADYDVGITVDSRSQYEPLFAYYRKTALGPVEEAISAGRYKLSALMDKLSTRIVTGAELGGLWNDKLLLNINYPHDYDRLLNENTL